MATPKLVREGFNCPMPKPGDGTRIMRRPDGSLYCSWDRPAVKMALDAAIGGPPDYPDYNATKPTNASQATGSATGDVDLPSRAEILRRVAASGEVRAQRVLEQNAKLMDRFPALKNARVA